MAEANIRFNIGFDIDRQSYQKLQDSLDSVIREANNPKQGIGPTLEKQLKDAGNAAKELKNIMNQSWDGKLNQFNLTTMTSEFKKAGQTATQYFTTLSNGGKEGAAAADLLARNILNSNIQLKESNKLLDRMAVTFKNTVRYGISSSVFNTFTNSIQKAYNYTKNLDTSLNDIRIVSGKSADEMARLAINANKTAQALGKTTLDYTKAATIYYQQGLNSDEVEKRTEATLKAANVTGQNAQEVSEQLTAVWNGYRVTGKELELYVDKLAAVAAHSASNLEELSTGMSKVASAAKEMGVNVDQLNAQMSTIISVTRQAPESVGTALRTIYARIADIKAGLDEETSLGNYSGKMAQLGINVLKADGSLRDMGEVIEEIGGKWQDLDTAQRIALARTMAGTRQYNNLLTLFNNWDKYQDALEISSNAAGELQKQQDIYMESTEAHLKQLTAEAEELYATLFDQDAVKSFLDILKSGLSVVNNYVKSLGGGFGTVLGLSSQIANIFSTQIASGLNRSLENLQKTSEYRDNNKLKEETLANINQRYSGKNENYNTGFNGLKAETNQAMAFLDVRKQLTAEQQQEYINNQKNIGALTDQLAQEKENVAHARKMVESFQTGNQTIQKMAENAEKANKSFDIMDPDNVKEAISERYQIINDPNAYGKEQIKEARQELQVLLEYQKAYKAESEGREAVAAIEAEIEARKKANEEMRKQAQEQAQLNSLIRGLSAAVALITTTVSIFNTVSDKNLSFWDKFKTIAGTLVMQLPLLIRSFKDLTSIGPNLNAVIGRLTTSLIGETAATEGASTAMTIFKLICGDPVALGVAIAAIVALTAALTVATAEFIDANTGLNYYNKKVDETAEKVTKAKEAYEEIKNSISSYTEAKKGIESLTEGTLEYYDAILKANEAAQELIDSLGLLAGQDFSVSKDGLIQISDDVLAEKQFREQQKIYQTQMLNTQARIDRANYKRDQAVIDLSNATEKKVGNYRVKVNTKGAEDILNNLDVSKGDLEITELYHKAGEKILEGIENSEFNITEEVGQYRGIYNNAIEEAKALKRQLADQLIRGYANKEQVDLYNSMTSSGKATVQDYVAKYTEERGDKRYYKERDLLNDFTSTLSSLPVLGDLWKGGAQFGAGFFNPTEINASDAKLLGNGFFTKEMQDRAIKARKAEESDYEYKEGILGFLGLGGLGSKWIDKNTGQDVTDIVNSWDADQIVNEKRMGTAYAEDATRKITDIYTKSMQASSSANRGTDAQKYIADAMMSMATGGKTLDTFKKLNEEDRNVLREQIKESTDIPTESQNGEKTKSWYLGQLDSKAAEYDNTARVAADTQAYNQTLADQAEQLGTSKKALEIYGAAMQKAGDITNEANTDNANAIANSYKFNKAFNETRKTYLSNIDAVKKYTKAMKEGKKIDYETADAVAEVATQLEDMGLSLSGETIAEHAEEINTLLTGTEEEAKKAYEKLYELSQLDALKSLFGDTSSEEQKEKFKHSYQEIVDQINKTEVGKPLKEEYEQSLREMIESTDASIEQIKTLSQKLGITIPVEYNVPDSFGVKDVDFTTNAQSVTHRYTGEMPNPAYNPEGKGDQLKKTISIDYAWVETTEEKHDSFKIPKDTNFTVTNTKKTSTAGANFGKAPSSNPSSKKSGSTAKPEKKDLNKDELDRYQLVNVQLKEIGKQLTALDKAKKKLLGGPLINNLNKQISLLNRQISVTQAKLKIAQEEQAEVAKKLSGYGVTFDQEGNIANYKETFQKRQNELNNYIKYYNGLSKQQQESQKDELKKRQEDWESFKKLITKYDTLIGDTIPQSQQEVQDAFDKQTEMYIEEFNMEIKARLDMSEATRDWNAFKRKVIDGIKDDDILGVATARLKDFYTYYNEASAGEIQALTKRIQDQLEIIRQQEDQEHGGWGGSGDWYRDDYAKSYEDLKEYYENIKESLSAIVELEDEMHQAWISMLDEAQEKFDDQVNTFENINKQLEHNVELINLLSDEDNYEDLAREYALQTKNRQEQLDFQTKEKEYWSTYMSTLEQGSEEWENAKEKYNAAAEAWASALETTIQAARTEFENNINLIFKTINNQLTNGKGLEYLDREWELIEENSGLALDNINRLQGIQDLNKKYTDAINGTSSATAQKKLAELRDKELAQLKDAEHLSEADLERAEKKLEIAKAQIALEDAQRNKSQMRLRRDSQGNYRYQFVADEDEINKAQEQLSAAYNDLYNFDKSRFNETSAQIYEAYKSYQEELRRIALINDPEKRQQEEALATEKWHEKKLILEENFNRAQVNLQTSTFASLNSIYAQDASMYEQMTAEQQAALNEFEKANQTAFDLIFELQTENTKAFRDMDQAFKDTIVNSMVPQWTAGIQTLINSMSGEAGFQETATNLWNDIQAAIIAYGKQVESISTTAKGMFDSIVDAQQEILDKNTDILDDNDVLIDKYAKMTAAVEGQYKSLKNLMEQYKVAADEAKKAAEDAYNKIMQIKAREAADAEEFTGAGFSGDRTPGEGEDAPIENLLTVHHNEDEVPTIPFNAVIPKGVQLYNSSGGKYNQTQANRAVQVKADVGTRYLVWGETFNPHHVYVDKNAVKYDTGGYTGAWGETGRLAVLHQKELVLNSKDTANMLNAVEILRGITDNIGADLLGRMASITANGFNSSFGGGSMEQNVHIEATFPGVKSSLEIQDALNNLVNMAAQRAQVK